MSDEKKQIFHSDERKDLIVLSIDTSKKDKISVSLEDATMTSLPTSEQKAQQILKLIDEIIKKTKTPLSKISEVRVNVEGESFTGLRVGVTVANALAYVLRISVNGNPVGKYVEPIYQGRYGGEE